NEKFRTYVAEVAAQALKTTASNTEEFLNEKWDLDPSLTVGEKLSSMISIIGENMSIRRFEKIEENAGCVVSYIHAGGKIGVLVDVTTDVVNDEIKEMAKNVAMQVAALHPKYTSDKEVDAEYLAKEREILLAQIKNDPKEASKPEKVIMGMIEGRIKKELKEICLLDQQYVKAADGKQSVAAYVAEVAKANNANISIKGFVRFETGEGLEKKSENFAEEVAKQMSGN
ncbi:MAG: translation elongation factor Ts, partial [Lachnospiraceae bacterium]